MTEDQLGTNLLTLYAQLTPWVQAFVALLTCIVLLGIVYFIKETVVALTTPFIRRPTRRIIRRVQTRVLSRNGPTIELDE
ncbi:hypothetical protein [Pseudochelatococcus contaminans]|uniref:Uncharacterized protein n=1 Tax=Pseudochelatococcus contaminans TaxID=1538103 RepID=A0A7W5Z160_9HYPH|nr:hypothetical protein [Pseudochelatococcus contaminans]MBB3808107.1 hypothetical protein [Pseudochelatococcus contaminans]